MTTELLLVRHGEVVGTQGSKSVSGHEDPPLSDKGRQSADQMGKKLASEQGLAALYTSPLRRAMETAQAIASYTKLEPQLVEAFREWDFQREMSGGDRLQLRIVTTLSHIGPFRRLLAYQWANSPALRTYVGMVAQAMHKIVDAHPNQRVVVVSHGGTIDALLTHYFPSEEEWERGVIRNCSLTRVEVGPDGAKLLAFNDCSHLQ
jgi:broad specificity phosphatase PhoE